MAQDWADTITAQLLSRGLIQTGICLILGGADTGKTSLAAALARRLAESQPVGIVDADIGQSHIGPPATVGWALLKDPEIDFTQLSVGGISFVGDVTPVGHLLQLTSAVTQCVQQVSKVTELIIIDTPGLIHGPAAAALWWTVQRILQPKLILAVQRNNELSNILIGLQYIGTQIELISSPPRIPVKSPRARQSWRRSQFSRYFQNSCLYNISLSMIAVQLGRNLSRQSLAHRLVALRDGKGIDIAIGLITDGSDDRNIATVRAPKLDIQQIHCLVIGDVSIEITESNLVLE